MLVLLLCGLGGECSGGLLGLSVGILVLGPTKEDEQQQIGIDLRYFFCLT